MSSLPQSLLLYSHFSLALPGFTLLAGLLSSLFLCKITIRMALTGWSSNFFLYFLCFGFWWSSPTPPLPFWVSVCGKTQRAESCWKICWRRILIRFEFWKHGKWSSTFGLVLRSFLCLNDGVWLLSYLSITVIFIVKLGKMLRACQLFVSLYIHDLRNLKRRIRDWYWAREWYMGIPWLIEFVAYELLSFQRTGLGKWNMNLISDILTLGVNWASFFSRFTIDKVIGIIVDVSLWFWFRQWKRIDKQIIWWWNALLRDAIWRGGV